LAVVITNLFSAIPWIGNDLVESNYLIESILPTIGNISPHAYKKIKKLDKNYFLTIPSSFLAMLIGLIDGDGYFLIHKTPKNYIKINLTISLHINDLPLLQYIHSILKLGKVSVYSKIKTCKFIINKTELQDIFLPLLLHYQIYPLTYKRNNQFNKVFYIFKNNIKYFTDIPFYIPYLFILPNSCLNFIKISYFNNWIIGFTIAEGSFLIKSNNDGCFQLKHTKQKYLLESILLELNSNKKIYLEKDKYSYFSISSKNEIQNVIKFFSFSGNHPLIGLKLISYQQWIKSLKNIKRYKDLKFPNF
jgi:hypothetical protein